MSSVIVATARSFCNLLYQVADREHSGTAESTIETGNIETLGTGQFETASSQIVRQYPWEAMLLCWYLVANCIPFHTACCQLYNCLI